MIRIQRILNTALFVKHFQYNYSRLIHLITRNEKTALTFLSVLQFGRLGLSRTNKQTYRHIFSFSALLFIKDY